MRRSVVCSLPNAGWQDVVGGWIVHSGSDAIATVRTAELPGGTTIYFRNVSSQQLLAFVCTYQTTDGTVIKRVVDWFVGDQPGPQKAEEFSVALTSDEARDVRNKELTVSAAIFADGTSRGSQDYADEIRFRWLGHRLETERLREILDEGPDRYATSTGLTELRRRVGSLPASAWDAIQSVKRIQLAGMNTVNLNELHDDTRLRALFAGIQHQRFDMLRDIEALAAIPEFSGHERTNRSSRLLQLHDQYVQKAARHRALADRMEGVAR